MDNEQVKEFVQLTTEIKKHEFEITALKKERVPIEESLIEDMVASGQQSASFKNLGTVSLVRTIWGGYANGADALHQALIQSGYGDLVDERKINTQSLSSLIREFDCDGLGSPILPEPLKDAVKVTEKISVRLTK